MNLLDLAQECNLNPKRTASTNGGEYHSHCPACGGDNRFMFWPNQGRYWCRQCDTKGDSIQFCRDFMNMDYRTACAKLGIEPKLSSSYPKKLNKPKFSPTPVGFPSDLWQKKASEFMWKCHHNLLHSVDALNLLSERGFSLESMQSFCLGWNTLNQSIALNEWDLPLTFKEDGQERRLWLPKGIVIPTKSEGQAIKLKIRRSDWNEADYLPKYAEVSGSIKAPSIYGDVNTKVAVIVEAELDAMLIQQYSSDLCCCIAIGGAGKKPDLNTDCLLRAMSILFFALDFDEAGKKAFQFWKSTYPTLHPWPVPSGKSPGDALKLGIDLRKWIMFGLQHTKSR